MKGTVWQRCTRCRRKVNGSRARAAHKSSGCGGRTATWAFKVDLGREGNGERRQAVRGGFASEAEAERELRSMLNKIEGGRYIVPTTRTLGAFLVEEWLTATAPPRVTESTYAKRELHVDNYVLPRIGAIPLSEVNGAQLDHLYATLIREGGRDGRPLSASSVRGVHATLNKAFTDARRWRLIDRNPCEEADPPRLDRVAEDARARLHVWTADDLGRFLQATRESRYGAAFYVGEHDRDAPLGALWTGVAGRRPRPRHSPRRAEARQGRSVRRHVR